MGEKEVAAWYRNTFEAVPMKPPDPSMTDREKFIYRLTAEDFFFVNYFY